MSFHEGSDISSRPRNNLLRHINEGDYALIAPHLEVGLLAANEVLYNPGDDVETVYFPCEGSVACFVLVIEDGREVQVVLIGREGAVGGIVSQGRLPAFSRIMVRFGGPFARLPIARLQAAKKSRGRWRACSRAMLIACSLKPCRPAPATPCIRLSSVPRSGSSPPWTGRSETVYRSVMNNSPRC
jgi:hypothetical protein